MRCEPSSRCRPALRHLIGVSALAMMLVGCADHPLAPPSVALPATLTPGTSIQPAPLWPDALWWQGFGSGELDALVTEAYAANPQLAAAAARVNQAAALVRIARAPLLPSAALGADVVRQSANGSTGALSGTYTDATLSASYEIDFWGRNRALAAAARAHWQASRFARQTVALALTASVADDYFQVLGARDRLALARESLDNARAVLRQVEARAQAGAALASDVAQQRSLVATQEATVAALSQSESDALTALAVLLGRPPQGFRVDERALSTLTLPAVSPGLPSELLTRRPDIAKAEAELAAANADVVAARAALLPQIDLGGSAGVQTAAEAGLPGATGSLYTLAAGLTQPIFDHGALAGQRDYTVAEREEVLAHYVSAVVAAFADVQHALAARAALARERSAEETAVREAQRALELVTARYRAGAADLLSVLDAERAQFSAQDALSQIELAQLQAEVALFEALGGGWHSPSASDKSVGARSR